MNTALHLWRHAIVMFASLFLLSAITTLPLVQAEPQGAGALVVYPQYPSAKVVYDFYFDHPDKINSGLYWIRSLIQPLMDSPYNEAPEMMNIV
ncbi:MAG: hypothetical protein RBR56_07360, partial [Halothiobacillus sp.]|nr:hypothetical protein [Halothiobacillus sp.]